jgi:hydroxypyruvate isomerase
MPRFAANLSMLFTEVPMPERFERAARAGFRAVELQFPYDWPAAELRRRLDDHGLQMVLHNLPAGDWAGGERGIACLPDRVQDFRDGVERAIDCAQTLGVTQLNALAGKAPAGVPRDQVHDTLVANLAHAAARLKSAGMRLLVEPVNPFDVPGFFVERSAQAAALLDEVGADNAFIQYDVYHAQRAEGELAATLKAQLPRIGHVQIADNPGRHEPGSGEIHFPFLFTWLDEIGYDGWVGCEYKPATTTEAGLGWLQRLAR